MPDEDSGPVEIREMRPGDVDDAMAVLDHWNMAPREGDPDAERSTIRVENSFVAVDDGAVVGVASFIVHDDELAETASLAVHPDYRGRGIGYRLQVARLLEMRARGIRRVHTETDRPETVEWYVERFGYERAGTNPKKHAFSLPDVDEWTVLELDLDVWRATDRTDE